MQMTAAKDASVSQHEKAQTADIAAMTFEVALKELEQIVTRLERGDVELEQSIEIYERGEALRSHCDQLLKRAEAKVERITLNAQGQPTSVAPLDQETAKSAARDR